MFRVELCLYDLDRPDAPMHLRSFLADLSSKKALTAQHVSREHGRYVLVIANESVPASIGTYRIDHLRNLFKELVNILGERDAEADATVTVMGLPDTVRFVGDVALWIGLQPGPAVTFIYQPQQ